MNNQRSINLKTNINQLVQENKKLKKKLQSFQEKEKIYQSSISKLKKFQAEYQQTFNKALNDYKLHEEQIKKTYINYQKLIENHYKENENRFLDENAQLNLELKQKDNIIKNLNNKIRILNKKLNKVETDFKYENKKLESEVVSKERRLSELNESMIQLARNTNDEIKLLRDEFEIFNKRRRNTRHQSLQKTEDYENNSFKNDNPDESKPIIRRYYYENAENNKKRNDYLINKINLLENQNKILFRKLKRKEEELAICNKLKNELFYNNNMKNSCPYFSNDNNGINNLKYTNSSINLRNYKSSNNLRNPKYNKFYNKSHYDIYKPNLNGRNVLNQNYNLFKEKIKNIKEDKINDYSNYNELLNDYDINELVITSNQNNFQNFNELGNNEIIQEEETIKDEYINSKLPKINTLE